MYRNLRVVAIVPALNEQKAIGKVVNQLLALGQSQNEGEEAGVAWVDRVIVCDNGSNDDTAEVAKDAGATVVKQEIGGYGIACLTAMSVMPACDIVLFVDGDDSCYIPQAEALLDGVFQGGDLIIGSRVQGEIEAGALTLPQLFGNRLAVFLINYLWKVRISDLGPFRAIRRSALDVIAMQDKRFGWTVEMQIKAIQYGLIMNETPVNSKVRIGQSKISGTIKGVIGAGLGIIGTIAKMRVRQRHIPLANIRHS
ncbi:MAG: glycosyltransferase involved in cell wall biosynthesis [Lentisphaeria bacterium]|jgi:glycosyltransferase involved in cell wall biosynthesis